MNPWELHPAIVHFPIAFLLLAVAMDLIGWRTPGADLHRWTTRAYLLGVGSAVVAASAGVLAFYTVPKGAHTAQAHERVLWHLWANAIALTLFSIVAAARWRRPEAAPGAFLRALGLAGAVVLLAGAYLGGDIVYHGGMGVDPKVLLPDLQKVTSPS